MFVLLVIAVSTSCKDANISENKATVYIKKTGDSYQLIRNNHPYFINGGAAHPDFLLELKLAGANTARIYDTINLQAALDKAHQLGLAVVADIPLPKFKNDPEFYENQVMFDLMEERVRNTIVQYKDHPALLYWNLGNELYYPYMYKRTKFHRNFNSLIDMVHEVDPNHPVSTVTIGANRFRVLSIITRSPQLDFISFNSFGVLGQFSDNMKPIEKIWNGPHVITEWGINGPWEAQRTLWDVPIEETSTKKAEQIKDRYNRYMKPLSENNSLGSFIFYWGFKYESTNTWFSLFGKDKTKTQAAFEMNKIWTGHKRKYPGPKIDYILMNEKGALDNIVLPPNIPAQARIAILEESEEKYEYHWEIRSSLLDENEGDQNSLPLKYISTKAKTIEFETPKKEGPYRLYLYATNGSDYIATANIPFYILDSKKYD